MAFNSTNFHEIIQIDIDKLIKEGEDIEKMKEALQTFICDIEESIEKLRTDSSKIQNLIEHNQQKSDDNFNKIIASIDFSQKSGGNEDTIMIGAFDQLKQKLKDLKEIQQLLLEQYEEFCIQKERESLLIHKLEQAKIKLKAIKDKVESKSNSVIHSLNEKIKLQAEKLQKVESEKEELRLSLKTVETNKGLGNNQTKLKIKSYLEEAINLLNDLDEDDEESDSKESFVEDLSNGITLEMVLIPGGQFWMGSPETEEDSDDEERPQHLVTVSPFYMGRFQVTQGQWKAIAERTDLKVNIDLDPDPSYFEEPYEEYDRWCRPVERVSWYEAKEFCARLSRLTGKEYRLPTEAEWEYACRSVISDQLSVISENLTLAEWNEQYNQPFHFGEIISTEVANYDGNYTYGDGVQGEYREETTPVGYFKVANAFGLYDMHGNVWEWCEDDWHDNYEGAPDDGSAWIKSNDDDSGTKIFRGGSWINLPFICRSANRNNDFPRDGNNDVGFRVVSRTL